MKKPGTIPGRSNTRGLPGLGKAGQTRPPTAPTGPKGKKKKKIKTITVGGESGVKVLEIGHKNPEGLKDAKKIKGKPHSSPEGRFFSKLRTQPLKIKFNKGGRAAFQGGGRTNLLEELGRVEGERSNRNRRAEVSRIHGELNKGYSLGGRVGAAKRGFNKKILRKD